MFTHIISPEYRQVEGHELHGDDAQDPLQAVDCVRQLDGLIRHFLTLCIVLAAQDDGATLSDKHF